MAEIKSALEIALERTESVKTDKASIGQFEAKQLGKRLANAWLEKPEKNLEDEIKKHPKDQFESIKQGLYDVLIPQITLPASEEDLPRIEAIGKALRFLLSNENFNNMYKQLIQVLSQYLNEVSQYDQLIRQQYAPKLRQKEEELSRRMGREVRLDPFQDPEFIAFYNKNLSALKENYQTVVNQVRDEAIKIWNEGKE